MPLSYFVVMRRICDEVSGWLYFKEMKRARSKQFIVSILTILSLAASSVAACACSHHGKRKATQISSCHQHSNEKQAEQREDPSFESASSRAECTCALFVSNISAKSSNLKFEKQAAAALAKTTFGKVFVSPNAPAIGVFSKPFYLSDSFYNLHPTRAPPLL